MPEPFARSRGLRNARALVAQEAHAELPRRCAPVPARASAAICRPRTLEMPSFLLPASCCITHTTSSIPVRKIFATSNRPNAEDPHRQPAGVLTNCQFIERRFDSDVGENCFAHRLHRTWWLIGPAWTSFSFWLATRLSKANSCTTPVLVDKLHARGLQRFSKCGLIRLSNWDIAVHNFDSTNGGNTNLRGFGQIQSTPPEQGAGSS
jgi:hypothetical protein